MLVVIPKLETDDEDIDNLTPSQGYLGRFLLLATLAATQGLVTGIGDLIIGIQCASAPVFLLTCVITSLVYMSVIFALSTTFMHVGKGVCVALVILQVPGASGLYPIEMMPGFFRTLYPLLPFTYSIANGDHVRHSDMDVPEDLPRQGQWTSTPVMWVVFALFVLRIVTLCF